MKLQDFKGRVRHFLRPHVRPSPRDDPSQYSQPRARTHARGFQTRGGGSGPRTGLPLTGPMPPGGQAAPGGLETSSARSNTAQRSCQVLPPRASRRTVRDWSPASLLLGCPLVPLRLMSTPRSPWFQEHHSPPPKAPFSPDSSPDTRRQPPLRHRVRLRSASPGGHPVHWELLLLQGPSRDSLCRLPSV